MHFSTFFVETKSIAIINISNKTIIYGKKGRKLKK